MTGPSLKEKYSVELVKLQLIDSASLSSMMLPVTGCTILFMLMFIM